MMLEFKQSGKRLGNERKSNMAQYVYGKQVCKRVLKEDRKVFKLLLANHDSELEALAKKKRVPVEITDKKVLKKLTKSDNHQGMVAQVEDYQLYSVDDIVTNKKGEHGLIIMLDEMEDPHNLGAVLRSADAIQADGVIFKKNHNAPLNATVAKVSAGAIDTVKCAAVTNLTYTVQDLKKRGYWVVAADMDGQDYRSLNYDFDTVLVIGNEGKGISRLLREQCDYVVSLPMCGKISSLNASVSAGILMYEIHSKRHPVK